MEIPNGHTLREVTVIAMGHVTRVTFTKSVPLTWAPGKITTTFISMASGPIFPLALFIYRATLPVQPAFLTASY